MTVQAQAVVLSASGAAGAQPSASASGDAVKQGIACNLTKAPSGLVVATFHPLLELHSTLPHSLQWQLQLPAEGEALPWISLSCVQHMLVHTDQIAQANIV